MPSQKVMVGRYTYEWHGNPPLEVGDVVVLPPNWLFEHETEGVVTSLASDYSGPLSSIRRLARRPGGAKTEQESGHPWKNHRHDIQWQHHDDDDISTRRATTVEVIFLCGCRPDSIRSLADYLEKQLGWSVTTSTGWGCSYGPGEPMSVCIHVWASSLNRPKSQSCRILGREQQRRAAKVEVES